MTGRGSNKAIVFVDAGGSIVTIKLAGPGTATVNFGANSAFTQSPGRAGDVVSAAGIAILDISTTGTSAATSLNITTRGGNGTVTIGGITVDASIKAINAKTTTLLGTLSIVGSLNKLVLGAANAATMSVGGALQTLQIGTATGASLSAVGPVHSIAAGSWNGSGAISAPSITSINIKGNATFNVSTAAIHSVKIRGTLSSSQFTLTTVGGLDLATLTAGAISGTTINAAGDLGNISAYTRCRARRSSPELDRWPRARRFPPPRRTLSLNRSSPTSS